jgi:2-dehydro-3-deoxyphosphooctonate aldolase (KDO 8-P synthase)
MKPIIIAGPCVIEDNCLTIAKEIAKIAKSTRIKIIFKASYDKANRSSGKSYRGPGLIDGIKILNEIKHSTKLEILTDIHEPEHARLVSQVADIIQIPAFLCRQTDLLVAAAKTGKTINIKKAQFLSPNDMINPINKVHSTNRNNIMITERGTCFGYNNLISDMRSIPIMKKFGYPIIYDATHSVQIPGGLGYASSGNREFIEPLAMAAIAAGADGLFVETHPNPDKALSDGANMLHLDKLEEFIIRIIKLKSVVDQMPSLYKL